MKKCQPYRDSCWATMLHRHRNYPNKKVRSSSHRIELPYYKSSSHCFYSSAVQEQVELWATKSGVVGDFFGDEFYQDIQGVAVSQSNTVIGCLADFWQAIANVIDDHTDEFSPVRWITPQKNTERIHFVVFPNCPDLYHYKTMFTFVTAMEFSKELCLHMGKRFSITLFHPHFKDSPKLFSPERHSPFPVSGLQFGGRYTIRHKPSLTSTQPKRQRGNGLQPAIDSDNDSDDDDDEESPTVASRIRDLEEQRKHFEVLYNSAAASGSHQDTVLSTRDYHTSTTTTTTNSPDSSLSLCFQQEQQIRRRNLSNETVQEMSQRWMEQNVNNNRALQFMDTIETYSISEHKIAEKVYADIWRAINDLFEDGRQADREAAMLKHQQVEASIQEEARSESQEKGATRFHQFEWMKSLSRPWQSAVKSQNDEEPRPVVKSSIFVATKFCAYNAESFKRFAITINAALKRLTDGRMFLEVFHPEYVGKQGFDNAKRRSPFPMIQICYEVKPQS